MITKEQAVEKHTEGFYVNSKFYHVSLKRKDGSAIMARRNGKTKTFKSKENLHKFKIPIKVGLYEFSYITDENAEEWEIKN